MSERVATRVERPLVLCVAAEASGDTLLASLLPQLKALAPSVRWEGIGGPLSVNAGLVSHINPKTLSAHGLTEALSVVPAMLNALKVMSELLPEASALLLVDAPELNMRLLKRASRRSIPIAYLAPPQVWAWRPWRARTLRRASWLGCLFAFEERWFRQRGLRAEHIGHPLTSLVRQSQATDDEGPCRLLLAPGSRRSTVKASLHLMLSAALLAIHTRGASFKRSIIIAVSPWVVEEVERQLRPYKETLSAQGVQLSYWDQLTPLRSPHRERYLGICHAGTATLELGLAQIPTVVIAPLSPLSTFIAKRFIRVPYFSLPNVILKRRVFVEIDPEGTISRSISDEVVKLSAHPNYNRTKSELSSLSRVMKTQDNDYLARKLIEVFHISRFFKT